MTTLVAIGFLDEVSAAAAAHHLRRQLSDIALDADAIAVVSRDARGTIHVTTSHQAVLLGSIRGAFWPPLIGLLCLFPLLRTGSGGDLPVTRELQDSGVVEALREPVLDMLQPASSVLFVAVGPTVPSSAIAGTVRRFGGTVATAALPARAEIAILGASGGPTTPSPPDAWGTCPDGEVAVRRDAQHP